MGKPRPRLGPALTVHEVELATDPLHSDTEVFIMVHGRQMPVNSVFFSTYGNRLILATNSTRHLRSKAFDDDVERTV